MREDLFTLTDEEKFIAYEEVRDSGAYNMLDPRAVEMSGLSKEDYLYVISNYEQLKKQYDGIRNE